MGVLTMGVSSLLRLCRQDHGLLPMYHMSAVSLVSSTRLDSSSIPRPRYLIFSLACLHPSRQRTCQQSEQNWSWPDDTRTVCIRHSNLSIPHLDVSLAIDPVQTLWQSNSTRPKHGHRQRIRFHRLYVSWVSSTIRRQTKQALDEHRCVIVATITLARNSFVSQVIHQFDRYGWI
ncbi:hypothetical protein CONLIGDRAFT_83340 [Coniochaeta ligniaria NRRL 30616]|uniref:Uncharacterized protein n=1 Tax=Coniochaeta ligniaria NRRL 30616 TaxID=1408157 RepID=A0A1J7ICH4_9PEZI|nr:hypothetical protein CONLIGDRAFT_83340 [Coniochaeta ligniaria NRRL 30616]